MAQFRLPHRLFRQPPDDERTERVVALNNGERTEPDVHTSPQMAMDGQRRALPQRTDRKQFQKHSAARHQAHLSAQQKDRACSQSHQHP